MIEIVAEFAKIDIVLHGMKKVLSNNGTKRSILIFNNCLLLFYIIFYFRFTLKLVDNNAENGSRILINLPRGAAFICSCTVFWESSIPNTAPEPHGWWPLDDVL